jgi:hypothetical protein
MKNKVQKMEGPRPSAEQHQAGKHTIMGIPEDRRESRGLKRAKMDGKTSGKQDIQ